MNVIEEAAVVCNTAEKALRDLMQKAITAGEYRHLPTLARMAEQIATLADRATQASDSASDAPLNTTATQKASSTRRPSKTSGRVPRSLKATPHSRVRSSRTGYPKFRKEDDALVKVGWSKKSRSEYEHRAPRRVIEEVMAAVAIAGQNNAVFTVDAFLPVHDKTDGSEIPSYQVYLVIAWLRVEGVIRQHGREGYSLMVAENPQKTIDERWAALPTETKQREKNSEQ